MPRNLQNKVIVITGASSGIGAATAKACAEAGMRVVAAARRIEKLQAIIAPMGDRGLAVACDVDRDSDVKHLFETAREHFGRVDAIFANAGYGLTMPVDQTTDEQTRAIFETNFHGTMRCIRFGLPLLRATDDGLKHMLICSSAASEIGVPGYGVYAATKAAQDSIAQAMRAELHHEKIYVTSVHPVGTRTEFFTTAAKQSNKPATKGTNTPTLLEQTPDHVAKKVVRALRRPRAEVWPLGIARFALGFATLFPGLTAWALRRKPNTNA